MKFFKSLVLFVVLLTFGGASMTITSTWLSGSGKASWYGDRFHGRLTASGEEYNMHDYTAAHKTLPFGTKVKITNPSNRKSVIVEINDRGPFVKSREFDLSRAAFAEIEDIGKGVLTVEYEILY